MKRAVLFVLLIYSGFVFAGGEVRVKGRKFVILPFAGGIWQKAPYGDLAIGHPFIKYINHYMGAQKMHSNGRHGGGYLLIYTKIGAEFNLDWKHECWGPKANAELDYKLFCVRANVIDYISSGKNNLYVIPETGLTLGSFISLTGGYNYPVSQSIEAIPKFRVSLNVLIPVAISGGEKSKKR